MILNIQSFLCIHHILTSIALVHADFADCRRKACGQNKKNPLKCTMYHLNNFCLGVWLGIIIIRFVHVKVVDRVQCKLQCRIVDAVCNSTNKWGVDSGHGQRGRQMVSKLGTVNLDASHLIWIMNDNKSCGHNNNSLWVWDHNWWSAATLPWCC